MVERYALKVERHLRGSVARQLPHGTSALPLFDLLADRGGAAERSELSEGIHGGLDRPAARPRRFDPVTERLEIGS